MHKLFSRQLSKATASAGEVDLKLLGDLVDAAYAESDRDRARTDRSISLMVEELDRLNQSLEQQVKERTATLREREAQLQAQNFLFDEAINNMTQALLMFDASGRLLISNHRFAEMYGLPADAIKAGATVQQLVQLRAQRGAFTGDPDEYLRLILSALARGETADRVIELPDGRTISILNRPIPGGGWVATHEDITERRRAEQQIAHMARHDPLTDLPNRLLFRERLAQALSHVRRGDRVALLYLDLDLFKNVNDTLGHQVGDELLKQVADRLQKSVRAEDTVARVGGDEFAVVQTRIGRPADTASLARRICDSLKSPFQLDGHTVVIDTSVGIALAPADGGEPDELLKNADMALYGAKADGRGSYRFFERDMDARMKERRTLEMALRQALPGGEFEIHYQPIVDLELDKVVCLEALVRWNHTERGLLLPGDFIPIAEEIGLIVPIGDWVLREACAEAAKWPDDVRVAVNLSPIQVMQGDMVSSVAAALDAADLSPRRLEIEITETVFMHHADTTLAALHRLRDLGLRISLDDFGTGYSSLSYLRSFPFDKIKIDQSFVADLSDDSDSIAIVRSIVGLAANLKMKTTAEGVETSAQLALVRALGCSEAQGFLLGHPRRMDEVARLFGSVEIANELTAA